MKYYTEAYCHLISYAPYKDKGISSIALRWEKNKDDRDVKLLKY